MEALRAAGTDFLDRPIYLACDTVELTRAGLKQQKFVQNELGKDFYLYEHWHEMPRDAHLIDFWSIRTCVFSFEGFYNTANVIGERNINGMVYQVIKKIKSIPTNTSVGEITRAKLNPIRNWYNLLTEIQGQTPTWTNDHGCCLPLAEIARKLHERTLVLPHA